MPPLSTLPPEMTTLGAHAHQIPIFFEGCSFLFFRNYITQKRTCVKIGGYFHFPGNSLYLPGEASPGPLLTLFSLASFLIVLFYYISFFRYSLDSLRYAGEVSPVPPQKQWVILQEGDRQRSSARQRRTRHSTSRRARQSRRNPRGRRKRPRFHPPIDSNNLQNK